MAFVKLPASGWSPCGASPAHIAPLVRAPLRWSEGGVPLDPDNEGMSEGKGHTGYVILNGAKRSEESPAANYTLDEIPRFARNDSGSRGIRTGYVETPITRKCPRAKGARAMSF